MSALKCMCNPSSYYHRKVLISFEDNDVIHLPLSNAEEWSPKVAAGDLLDKRKPTLCICKLGGRSMKMATFLATQAGFDEVIISFKMTPQPHFPRCTVSMGE